MYRNYSNSSIRCRSEKKAPKPYNVFYQSISPTRDAPAGRKLSMNAFLPVQHSDQGFDFRDGHAQGTDHGKECSQSVHF